MSTRTTRTYLSIGEVLSLLRIDFPDVTISKIRFLEGQGLVSPERTSSGYRKFHDKDVEQLRFVLQHQREQFLPLKVIRERMEEAGLAPSAPTKPPGARRRSVSELVAALQETPPTTAAAPAEPAAASSAPARSARTPDTTPDQADDTVAERPPVPVVTPEEAATAAGLEVTAIEALVEHGLLSTVRQGGVDGLDEDGVAIAKAAAGFLSIGLEPRHLKVLQHGVLREMDMLETLVRPLLQQRTPEGRVRAREEATQFARLGQSLRAAMLRRELRRTIG
jgi:DNA-binding transcriptional MerR regulator